MDLIGTVGRPQVDPANNPKSECGDAMPLPRVGFGTPDGWYSDLDEGADCGGSGNAINEQVDYPNTSGGVGTWVHVYNDGARLSGRLSCYQFVGKAAGVSIDDGCQSQQGTANPLWCNT